MEEAKEQAKVYKSRLIEGRRRAGGEGWGGEWRGGGEERRE